MTVRCGPTVLFDGVCNLCNGLVRFVAANDPAGRFRFAALQSPEGRALLAATGAAPQSDSVVLFDYGHRYERSDAALYLALGLRQPWPLAFAFIVIPRALRDAVYDWVARNRYRWFGRQPTCPLPTPALRARFLDVTVDDKASG